MFPRDEQAVLNAVSARRTRVDMRPMINRFVNIGDIEPLPQWLMDNYLEMKNDRINGL
jgi:hypothetical protein